MAYSIYDYVKTKTFQSPGKINLGGSGYYCLIKGKAYGTNYENGTTEIEITAELHDSSGKLYTNTSTTYYLNLDFNINDHIFNKVLNNGHAGTLTFNFTISNTDLIGKDCTGIGGTTAGDCGSILEIQTDTKFSHGSRNYGNNTLFFTTSIAECKVSAPSIYLGQTSTLPTYHIGTQFQYTVRQTNAIPYKYKFSYLKKGGSLYNKNDYVEFLTQTVNNSQALTDINMTLPLEMCSLITDSTNGKICFRCDAYAKINDSDSNFSAYLGYTIQKNTFYVPDNLKPTISSYSISPVYTDPNLMFSDGAYVGSYTRINARIGSTELYGATLASYKIWIEVTPGTQESLLISNNVSTLEEEAELETVGVVTPVLQNYYVTRDLRICASVTDSRGRTSETSVITIFLDGYIDTVSGTLIATRTDRNNNPNEEGTYIYCNCEATINRIYTSRETSKISLYEKRDGDFVFIKDENISVTGQTFRANVSFSNTDPYKDYKVVFSVYDGYEDFNIAKLVASNDSIIDIAPNGSVAIGKIASEASKVFEVNLEQKNYNNIIPSETGKLNLGAENRRWQTIYAVNNLNTSDARFKENINYVSSSNKARTSDEISQEDLHSFYKSDYLLTTYNYIGQEQQEYGFVTSDMYGNSVGESLIIRNEHGDFFSINSYISTIAGALQYEINLRDEQIATLNQMILEMQEEIKNLKQ